MQHQTRFIFNLFFVQQIELGNYDALFGAYHKKQHWKLLVCTNWQTSLLSISELNRNTFI